MAARYMSWCLPCFSNLFRQTHVQNGWNTFLSPSKTFMQQLVLVQNVTHFGTGRFNSSHFKRPPLVFVDITDEEMARVLVLQLKPEGRLHVLSEIHKMIEDEHQGNTKGAVPTREQMKSLFMFNALPFIGFGFLDNFIMIIAGEYIDATVGATLAISTMAAAAIGNLISDVAGIGLSGYVEVLVHKIGIVHPHLSPHQANMWQSKWTQTLGRTIGIIIGCLIGMLPLYFFDEK